MAGSYKTTNEWTFEQSPHLTRFTPTLETLLPLSSSFKMRPGAGPTQKSPVSGFDRLGGRGRQSANSTATANSIRSVIAAGARVEVVRTYLKKLLKGTIGVLGIVR
jgi:hypothetical protein